MPASLAPAPDAVRLVGGTLVDLETGNRSRGELAYRAGGLVRPDSIDVDSRVVELDPETLIVPGFVDLHVHVFDGIGEGVGADTTCLRRGTTTAVDAGSAGAATIGAFAALAASAQTRLFAWLNISTIGLIDTRVGELIAGPLLDGDQAVSAAAAYPDLVVGFKARLSTYAAGGGVRRVLSVLRAAANQARRPVMVHIGDTDEPLDFILEWLNAGDVVTHALTGRKHGILDEQLRIRPAVLEAQRRGVLFDVAPGRNHLSFRVLDAALAGGFVPDTLGTDMTEPLAGDAAYGQATIGTYLMAAGVDLVGVLDRLSRRAAHAIGLDADTRLEPGRSGDVTLLKVIDGRHVMTDVDGVARAADRRIQTIGVVRAGRYISFDHVETGG